MKQNERFAEWLDITLSNRGITGRQVARELGVNDSAVSRWRSGNGKPGLDSCMKLAKLLDVDSIRLSVTAGLMSPDDAGVDPLPMPDATHRRKNVREQILKIKGLSSADRQKLLEKYDELDQGA